MTIYNCLIVDDEPIARDIIKNYCGHLPYLNIIAASGNALEAKAILHQQKVDILFLDINMPIMDGISFLKTLKNPPQVIFTTAYKEYALDAFDLSACDYLLKPFSLERFIIAVDKATEKLQMQFPSNSESNDVKTEDFVFIKTDGKIFKILYPDLLFAEAKGNNTKIVTTQNTLVPAITFSAIEDLLPKSHFLRVHRSFIINKSRIDHIEGNRVFINNIEIPIGGNYREIFLKQLGFS
ncbi:LytR/AlgR family response regulator transcription factor [Dyadobacter frigoris]|uniref:Response regulator transcription factor n=1 Tax=Dyadobacter frigoris TaxID=2576211 RepID=A0A4U6D621_9BACT|nr:LytTR family DNA-binding domain-containing protein [Dyadobacter frigoris]TKT92782.1 response regulator transcription factor [Dyadobacter frigoris]GLU51683.1 DNA-binding response regulator [Dyadobacter frigoris]